MKFLGLFLSFVYTIVIADRFDICQSKTCRPGGNGEISIEQALVLAPCLVYSGKQVDCYNYVGGTKICPFDNSVVDCSQAPVTTVTPSPTTTTITPSTTKATETPTSSLRPSSTTTSIPSTSSSTLSPTPNTNTNGGSNSTNTKSELWPFLLAGGVALIALGILVIFLVRKSRRHDDDDDDAASIHMEQRTKQISHEPAYIRQSPVPGTGVISFTPSHHNVSASYAVRKESNDYGLRNDNSYQVPKNVQSPYHGRTNQNESFVRPRLPSGPMDHQPIRIEPTDYRTLEAERGSVTF